MKIGCNTKATLDIYTLWLIKYKQAYIYEIKHMHMTYLNLENHRNKHNVRYLKRLINSLLINKISS